MANETETKTRANGIKEVVWDGSKATWKFIHGETLTLDTAKASPEMKLALLQHGVEARVGDKAAVSATEYPDRTARSREALRRMRLLVDHIESGATGWKMASGATGPRIRVDLIHKAMIELKLATDEANAIELLANLAKTRNVDLTAIHKLFAESKDVGKRVRELAEAERTYSADAASLIAEMKKAG